ncbi:hypothetical protein N431DRAFT_434721 [Stipitochalara longipes BDJ]|nr:hypothetical protein N431DRAFT_434721 [Stipitochalara longipes BDJ]
MWVEFYCESLAPLREGLEKELLVSGREVVRYHEDSDSEDKSCDSESGGEKEDEDDNGSDSDEERESRTKLKPIAAADDDMVPKYATCLNCKVNFDVTNNERGYCRWHTGEKEADWDGDFWADHDEDCHGRIDDLIDEPDVAEGFKWSCCQEFGDNEGCKSTRHKAAVNEVRLPPPMVVSVPEPASRKRKAKRQV